VDVGRESRMRECYKAQAENEDYELGESFYRIGAYFTLSNTETRGHWCSVVHIMPTKKISQKLQIKWV